MFIRGCDASLAEHHCVSFPHNAKFSCEKHVTASLNGDRFESSLFLLSVDARGLIKKEWILLSAL